MALVDYPSSDEEDNNETPKLESSTENSSLKRKHEQSSGLPPLPSKFHNLYASTTRVSTRDDPSLHEGRKRVIPHIEGNWPTHIYIECRCMLNLFSPIKALLSRSRVSIDNRGCIIIKINISIAKRNLARCCYQSPLLCHQ